MFRLRNEQHVASLNILAYARGVRRKDCGSAEDIFENRYILLLLLRPPKLVNSKNEIQQQTVR